MKWSEVRGELLKDEATFKAYIADKEREARIDELVNLDRQSEKFSVVTHDFGTPQVLYEVLAVPQRATYDRLNQLREEQDNE